MLEEAKPGAYRPIANARNHLQRLVLLLDRGSKKMKNLVVLE